MAQMSQLLDEALELNPEGRRRWLEALSPEPRHLELALRQALLPEESQRFTALPACLAPQFSLSRCERPGRMHLG
jgi:hypothetical protein